MPLLCILLGHKPVRQSLKFPGTPMYGSRCERQGCEATYTAGGWK